MLVDVRFRSGQRALIARAAEYYIQLLNLEDSRYTLTIDVRSPLNEYERSVEGNTFVRGRNIFVFLNSRQSRFWLLMTLSHEMLHVKQVARGQLRMNNEMQSVWCGRTYEHVPYEETPWEIQAYKYQVDLMKALSTAFVTGPGLVTT